MNGLEIRRYQFPVPTVRRRFRLRERDRDVVLPDTYTETIVDRVGKIVLRGYTDLRPWWPKLVARP